MATQMAVASPVVVEGRGRPEVVVPRIEAAIVVDGVLDEPAWAQAVRLAGFSQLEPVDGRPAVERTEVLAWYSPDAIHFGILAYDREPGSIRATNADRDAISGEDHVVIYLDTFNDRRRAYVFAVNPLAVQQDGVRTGGAGSADRMFGGGTDPSPDFLFESKGRITPEGYVVEVRIPFKSLRSSNAAEQTWGLSIERITRERDGSEFARTLIPRLEVEIQPTRAFFFRAVAEQRAERRAALADARTGAPLNVAGEPGGRAELDALRVDLLASYEPAPGTAVYVGYDGSLERSPLLGPAVLQRTSDGFFMKLAYRFRR